MMGRMKAFQQISLTAGQESTQDLNQGILQSFVRDQV